MEKDTIAHEEEPNAVADLKNQAELVRLTNEEDHKMGVFESLRKYPLAFVWSLYAVWCVMLVSFENQAAGSVISIPEFRKDFGRLYNGQWTLYANWQSAFSGGPVASGMVGAIGCGVLADWLGRRTVLMICLVISYAAVTLEFVATTNEMFFGGKFLNGFSIGAIASLTVTYIGEITPLALRGVLTCLSALSYTLGPLIVALIINWTGSYNNRWAYRAVFCSQYGIAFVATLPVCFMPESPWWLASKGKHDKALQSLARLSSKGEEGVKRLAVITQTLAETERETASATYLECFRPNNLRRTIISVAPLCIQSLSGIAFAAGYSTYYMQLAGYSDSDSFKLQIVQQVISLVGNVMSWYLVDRVGRRDLTFYGLCVLTVILMLMAGLAQADTPGTIKGSVAMILLYCWWYNVTIGATAYTILAEVSTSRLRVKTIAIGLTLSYGINMMWNFVLPYMFNPDHANMGAKVGFVFGGLAIVSLVYLWFELPETAGRTYEELDDLFRRHVPARKFKSDRGETPAEA